MPRRGTWTETGGGGVKVPALIVIAVVVAIALGSGAIAGIIAAITALLICVAVLMVLTVVVGGAVFWLTRGKRKQRNIDFAEARAIKQEQYYDELELRNARKAQINAAAQAQAWAPALGLIAEAIRSGNSVPEPAWNYRAEVVKEGKSEVE